MCQRTLPAIVLAIITTACGSSPTGPTPPPPALPAVTVPCDLPGTLPCQTAPKTQPTPTAPAITATIRGTVTDATSGGVLPGIKVAASGGTAAVTDGAGHYELADLAHGTVTITVATASYVTATKAVTLESDLVVDLVLQRTPAAPNPAPTPTIPTHGGIRSDTITITHDLLVGSPTPTSSANTAYCCWPFPVQNPGVYDFDLARFPLDNLPSGGNSNTVSTSEMILAGIRFSQPSTQVTTSTWHRVFNGIDSQFAVIATGAGAHTTALSYVGHFSWEITLPGWYYVVIDTEWGRVTIDFLVR